MASGIMKVKFKDAMPDLYTEVRECLEKLALKRNANAASHGTSHAAP